MVMLCGGSFGHRGQICYFFSLVVLTSKSVTQMSLKIWVWMEKKNASKSMSIHVPTHMHRNCMNEAGISSNV